MKAQTKQQEKKVDIRPYTRQFYRGNQGYILVGFLDTITTTAGSLMISWLMQQIVDLVAGEAMVSNLGLLVAGAVICTLIVAAGSLLAYWSRPRFISRGIAQYREYVFEELTKKNISAFSKENSSLYISALSNDVNTIENGYLANMLPLVENVLCFVGALAMMFWYSSLLTVIAIGLSLLPILASILTGDRMAQAEKKVSDVNETYMSTLKDSLTGFSVIKSFQAEERIAGIFGECVDHLAQAQCRKRKLSILLQLFGSMAGIFAQFGVFLIGAYLALTGKGVTAGMVIVFVQLMNYVLSPIANVPQYLAERKAARELIRKVAAILPENVRQGGEEVHTQLGQAIEVENLSFAYEAGKPVLQRIDTRFEAGKSYALVGASGSGKSTLLNLLMASHTDYEGAIYYDDTELRRISSESLYEMVSVVQQNVFIFNASIRDNITMFASFPKEEVDRAIRLSGLSELIAERGENYLCGENGSGLSGGEKQRISIARTLLKKSQVLLVDEATAALDAQTAFQVSDAILDLQGLTRIVVTHDLDAALLKRYDTILTLKNGQITESGSFEELMEKKGYFYSLYTVSQ